MKLSTRLWLGGTVLPSVGAAIAAVGAWLFFRHSLEADVDHALIAQAAVESVSLFDTAQGGPHLHLERSPLLDEVVAFEGEIHQAAVYDERGVRVLAFPSETCLPDDVVGRRFDDKPTLWTEDRGGHQQRILGVGVIDRGRNYSLLLSSSLSRVDALSRRFLLTSLGMVGLLAAALAVTQRWLVVRITRRVSALSNHMDRLARDQLDVMPPPDATGDELSDLRDAVAAATRELGLARAARERLLADAAHELKTPLSTMGLELDLALARPRAPEQLTAALRSTRDEVERLGHLAHRLLDRAAAGQHPTVHQPLDFNALILESVTAQLGRAEQKRLTIHTALPHHPVALLGDATGLRQVVDNLIDNAIKFSPVGGRVLVQLQEPRPSSSGVACSVEDDGIVLCVADDGPGVPEEERDAIFAPFHRAALQVAGTGLGLSLVREQVQRHGGQVRVVDAETLPALVQPEGDHSDALRFAGACFCVFLPVGNP